MVFCTAYSRSRAVPTPNHSRSLLDTTGYIPPSQMVKEFMLGGSRLLLAREGIYDIPAGKSVPDAYPARDYSTCELDIMQRVLDLKQSLSAQRAETKRVKAAAAAAAAAAPVPDPLTPASAPEVK